VKLEALGPEADIAAFAGCTGDIEDLMRGAGARSVHRVPQQAIDACLVALSLSFEPSENVGVDPMVRIF